MHLVGILITFLLGASLSSSVIGYYHPSPKFFGSIGSILSGSSSPFNIRNKLTLINKIKALADEFEDLEEDIEKDLDRLVDRFEKDLKDLEEEIGDDIEKAISDLESDFEELIEALRTELTPKCPTTATNGEVVGSKCYTVNAGPVDLVGARTACTTQGGILAEPPVGSTAALGAFVASLVAEFGSDLGLSDNPIIGVTEVGTDEYQYDSSGLLVSFGSFDVNPPTTSANPDDDMAVINLSTDNSLAVVTAATTSPFICQFDLE